MNIPRKATVLNTAGGTMGLSYQDSGRDGGRPVPLPFLGGVSAAGVFSGFSAPPPVGAQVLVLHEGWAGGMYPSASIGQTDTPAKLPAAMGIYAPDGSVLCQPQTAGGAILWQATTAGGGLTTWFLDAAGHLCTSQGTAPTISSLGAASGTGGGHTASVVAGSTDSVALISLTTGSSGTAIGTLLSIAFKTAYSAAPRMTISGATAASAALSLGIGSAAAGYSVFAGIAPAINTTYSFYVHAIG
jgi:hypothetical protein